MKTSTRPRLKAATIISLFAAALLLSALRAQAQANGNPPNFVTYQGYLVDANGTALGTNAPKNYDVIFRIWDAATGGATPLWAEQQTVTVDKGYFSVLLGEGSSIGEPRPALNTVFTTATASDRWVGLTVKGIGAGGADANILPRLRLLASPYSFLAQKAITASTVDAAALTGTVSDTRLSGNVALRNGGNTFTADQRFSSGSLFMDNTRAILAKNSSGADEVFVWPRYSDNVTYLNFGSGGFNIRNSGSTPRMFITDAGNVGIGTISPGFPLNFPDTTGDKISLWGQSGVHYGFGIRANLLQIHAAASADDIAFGYGTSANMTEVMRIKGNGNVGIGTSAPSRRLHVSGGDLQIDGGTIYVDNSQYLYAKNSAGAYEGFFVPRWSDNVMYLNYGANGFNLRNQGGATTMFMQNNGNVYFNGNVGIGTTNPTAKLHLQGSNVGIVLQDGGDTWSMYNESGTDSLIFQRAGGGYNGFRSNGAIISGSDVRLKKDIREMENILPRVVKLRPVSYRLKSDTDSKNDRLGFIAQEVEPLFPEVVSEMAGFKGIAYGDMVSIAIGAIKELNQIVREQESALAEKATKVDQLEKELAALRQQVAQQTQSQHHMLASDEKRDKRLATIEQLLRDKFPQQQAAIETSAVSNAK